MELSNGMSADGAIDGIFLVYQAYTQTRHNVAFIVRYLNL